MVDSADIVNTHGPLVEIEHDEQQTVESLHAVHIRVQQRNGRKSLTTVQGLDDKFDKRRILKGFKKGKNDLPVRSMLEELCCNGTVVIDPQLGQILQLQGDQRKSVCQFLVEKHLAKKTEIKVHGF